MSKRSARTKKQKRRKELAKGPEVILLCKSCMYCRISYCRKKRKDLCYAELIGCEDWSDKQSELVLKRAW